MLHRRELRGLFALMRITTALLPIPFIDEDMPSISSVPSRFFFVSIPPTLRSLFSFYLWSIKTSTVVWGPLAMIPDWCSRSFQHRLRSTGAETESYLYNYCSHIFERPTKRTKIFDKDF